MKSWLAAVRNIPKHEDLEMVNRAWSKVMVICTCSLVLVGSGNAADM